ncbi:hypothetical protein [Bacillus sp. FJAT-27986]|uniref:hypothetical protein n=1 Tax=Bacillus sp. FJAT-27986 TaxID=1743146 RepID=UPI00080ADF77|nr:hypothetical protein [Bacillus sp. FJAT-27986]OCA86920.1 hypothetical protein A8L44_06490 [Bacillus sp. FJAT-27986]
MVVMNIFVVSYDIPCFVKLQKESSYELTKSGNIYIITFCAPLFTRKIENNILSSHYIKERILFLSAYDLLLEPVLNFLTWSSKKEDNLISNKKKVYLCLFRLMIIVPIYFCIYIVSIVLVSFFGTTDIHNKGTTVVFYLSIILLLPLLLLLFLNILREENISDKILKFCLTFLITKDSIGIDFLPFKFIFHMVGGLVYILLSSFLSYYVILYLNINLYKYINQEGFEISLFVFLLIIHSSIYAFVLCYGTPEETIKQKFKKVRRKFFLWLFSMVITIGYVVISIFKDYSILHPFYFIFIILIAMERTIANYKALTELLSAQGFYEECLKGFKEEN